MSATSGDGRVTSSMSSPMRRCNIADNPSTTTLKNKPGSSYLIAADSGLDSQGSGPTAIDNAGTIRKPAGSATSTIRVAGTINNIGTIEAASGTLSLAATIPQIQGNALTAGTWNAVGGATLLLPNNPAIEWNSGFSVAS